jgi:hypothetical protein
MAVEKAAQRPLFPLNLRQLSQKIEVLGKPLFIWGNELGTRIRE